MESSSTWRLCHSHVSRCRIQAVDPITVYNDNTGHLAIATAANGKLMIFPLDLALSFSKPNYAALQRVGDVNLLYLFSCQYPIHPFPLLG
jgi:hypothetical protein